MNREQIEGLWNQLKGEVRANWGELTDDDVERVGGNMDQLVGVIQERYGIRKEEAERQVDDWRPRV